MPRLRPPFPPSQLRAQLTFLRHRCVASTSTATPTPSPTGSGPTIFAPATARGKAAISILRISGPEALTVWHQCTEPPHLKAPGKRSSSHNPPERKAVLRKILHPQSREVLDHGIVIYFPAHSALTSQPTLELHTHGSPALLQLLIDVLPTLSRSFRIAEPGEFTRLAFESGKMDLTEVEGIRDLVDAHTESQRTLAARQANGQTRKVYEGMRAQIIESTALVEALIDFGEDEGISEDVFEQARDKVKQLRDRIAQSLADGRRGEIIRSGIQLAIIGAPNAGKSSLLNWLGGNLSRSVSQRGLLKLMRVLESAFTAQREAAIVASTPGTTRDIVELSLDYHGFPITVADTAGLRKTHDEVEGIGIARALQKARAADVKLCVLSLPAILESGDKAIIDPLTLNLIDASTIVVLNKVDALRATEPQLAYVRSALASTSWGSRSTKTLWQVSLKTRDGLRELGDGLKEVLKDRFDLPEDADDIPLVTHARHRHHLQECHISLETFLSLEAEDIVSAAEELRYAVFALSKISGAIDTEEILGQIFSGFCIGK
ncbi:BZ3500_MvSof-1268-A1-R1_Chr5-2g08061 [Microbotryum saponariae]|uniref:BZ3500_MvSof-1268-A1-R1_Chr5-2g08061 protein n=1 Tax=Microbotryum saponariae TaxID=289078 RepID=A0A2X0LA60_9BASI|nr:BZ3500_MvSof-1268-A1-R1_Chr5-2g08061 [Microbotryum saponariae]SDA05930.1 BZ3501_MvSof-1269-A2-R1_Chr5-2g07883 [Microbotryum saponariae]